jgi:NADH:ubiquinone oxidoreductase subunit 3 (subunit A)
MGINSLFLLLAIFAFSFLIALIIYWAGGKVSAKGKRKKDEGKTIPYACGEEPPSVEEVRINLERLFVFAVYFLIFDVFAFIIAISSSAAWYLPTIHSIVVLMTILMFLIVRRQI